MVSEFCWPVDVVSLLDCGMELLGRLVDAVRPVDTVDTSVDNVNGVIGDMDCTLMDDEELDCCRIVVMNVEGPEERFTKAVELVEPIDPWLGVLRDGVLIVEKKVVCPDVEGALLPDCMGWEFWDCPE